MQQSYRILSAKVSIQHYISEAHRQTAFWYRSSAFEDHFQFCIYRYEMNSSFFGKSLECFGCFTDLSIRARNVTKFGRIRSLITTIIKGQCDKLSFRIKAPFLLFLSLLRKRCPIKAPNLKPKITLYMHKWKRKPLFWCNPYRQ